MPLSGISKKRISMNLSLSFTSLDYTLFVLYLTLLILFSWGTHKGSGKSETEFLLAGRRMTLPAFVATLVTTWYGGILGVGEYSFRYGISNWLVFGVPYYLAAIIFALFITRPARKRLLISIPDQLESAYGRSPALAGAIMLFIMTVPASYVLMLGELLHLFFGGVLLFWIIAGTLISTFYVAWGGFRAVVRTDKIQFLLMFTGFALLLFMAWRTYGGMEFLRSELPDTHLHWNGGLGMQAVLVWYFLAMATLVEPAFYQRVYAAKSTAVARSGILISILFWILFDFLTTFSGLYARAVLDPASNPTLSFPLLADKLLPSGAKGLFYLGLFSVVMSTVDSYSFLAAQTLGRDIIARWKNRQHQWVESRIIIGLVLSSLLAILIAAWKQTVVGIWHDLGSLGVSVLLFPMAGSFRDPPLFPSKLIVPSMIIAGSISLAWTICKDLFGFYPFSIEPVYAGLASSLLVLAVGSSIMIFHRRRKQ